MIQTRDLQAIACLVQQIKRLGPDPLVQVLQEAACKRREPLYESLATVCRTFLKAYENFNYNPDSNGETFVLRRIADVTGDAPVTLFDVGANRGDWASRARAAFPGATIHCFEVAPPTFQQLRAATAGLANVIANDFGLSDQAKEITIRYYPNASALTTATDYPHPLPSVAMVGRVMTGDAYMQQRGCQRIHFLKIDVEGMEMQVMQGLTAAIGSGWVDCIQFEYGQVNILSKILLYDFYRALTQQGYLIGKIYPNYVDFRNYTFAHEDFMGPNYLAVRRERSDLIGAVHAGN